MNWHIAYWCITLSILFSPSTYGFDLFDADRGKPSVSQNTPVAVPTYSSSKQPPNPFLRAQRPLPLRPKPPKKLKPQKDFILRGTSQIGEKRAVVLKGPDKKEFIQYFDNNQRTAIKGYPDYHLLGVEPRKVQIEYPAEAPCRKDNLQQGIECNKEDNGKTVVLKLVQSKAIRAPRKPQRPRQTPTAATSRRPAQLSPEEAKQREEERQKRRELYKNFKRKVIKDEDVPPGMRVVRTPFGDRLVPIK